MSIRFIVSIALLATIQCAQAETFINYQNHDAVVANSQCDMIYEQPRHSGVMAHANTISLTEAQPVGIYDEHFIDKAAMLHAMLVNTGKPEHFSQPPDMPVCHWTELVLKQHTRFKSGRAVLKYMPSNRNHSMERFYQRRRTAISM